MKNQMKLFTRMVMGIIVIISVTGCSNDEFFGFESSDNHFDDLNFSMAFKYGTFLDWDYNGILADASEEDKMIYFEAMQRCNYYYQNGCLVTNIRNAQDVNISESLFNYIQERVNESNRSFLFSTSQSKPRRSKNGMSPRALFCAVDVTPCGTPGDQL